jgi:hypothetical protein
MPSRAANPSTIPLDAVLVTGEPRARPSRPPEHAAENEALVELVKGLVVPPTPSSGSWWEPRCGLPAPS